MSSLYLPPEASPGAVTYRELAEHLKSLILRGDLQAGSQLPTVRNLAQQLDVSPLTVQRAYSDLAEAGLTKAQTGVGTFIAIPEVSDRARIAKMLQNGRYCSYGPAANQAGIRTISMAFPDPELHDEAEVLAAFGDLMRKPISGMFGASPTGLPEMIRQASRLLAQHGHRGSGDETVLTHGEVDATALLGRVLSKGRPILVQDPAPLIGRDVLESNGITTLTVPFDHCGLDLERLDKLAAEHTPAAFLITPVNSNPTGAVITEGDATELVKLARKHDFAIIEIGSDRWLSYDRDPPAPLLVRAPERVFFVDQFSFTVGPGIRLGYIRCPGEWKSKVGKLMTLTHLGPSNLIQAAMAVYLDRGCFHRHLARVVPKYRSRRDALLQAVELNMPSAKVQTPRGGLSAWITMPRSVDTLELHAKAVERGVTYLPGTMMTQACDAKHKLRICFGTLPPESLKEAVRELSKVLR